MIAKSKMVLLLVLLGAQPRRPRSSCISQTDTTGAIS